MPDYPERSERMREIIKRDREIARQISNQPKAPIDPDVDFNSMYPTLDPTKK